MPSFFLRCVLLLLQTLLSNDKLNGFMLLFLRISCETMRGFRTNHDESWASLIAATFSSAVASWDLVPAGLVGECFVPEECGPKIAEYQSASTVLCTCLVYCSAVSFSYEPLIDIHAAGAPAVVYSRCHFHRVCSRVFCSPPFPLVAFPPRVRSPLYLPRIGHVYLVITAGFVAD